MRRLLILVVLAACSAPPPREERPPAPSPPRKVEVKPEVAPVPSEARLVLDGYLEGALEARPAALALEGILGRTRPGDVVEERGWRVSSRRALGRAIATAAAPLRDQLRLVQEGKARDLEAKVSRDFAAGRLGPAIDFAERWPATATGAAVLAHLAKLRDGSHDAVDTSLLTAPVPPGGIHVGGLTVRGDGDDGLVASDQDANLVWEHRSGEAQRLLGTLGDRALVLETQRGHASLVALELATGNVIFRTALGDGPVHFVLAGPDAVCSVAGRVVAIDVYRGVEGWRRDIAGRVAGATRDAVLVQVSSSEVVRLDLATGRRLGAR